MLESGKTSLHLTINSIAAAAVAKLQLQSMSRPNILDLYAIAIIPTQKYEYELYSARQ